MHTSDDDDHFVVHAVEDCIREAMDQHAPSIAMNDGKTERMGGEIIQRGLNGRQEFIAQPGALALVPLKRLFHISGGRWTDNERDHRVRPRSW